MLKVALLRNNNFLDSPKFTGALLPRDDLANPCDAHHHEKFDV